MRHRASRTLVLGLDPITVTNGKIVGFDFSGIFIRVASRNRFSPLLIVGRRGILRTRR